MQENSEFRIYRVGVLIEPPPNMPSLNNTSWNYAVLGYFLALSLLPLC